MDYLSDFGHWLLLSDAGLIVGSVLIWGGLIALAWVLISRYGDVRMGPDPAPPSADATTDVIPVVPTEVLGVEEFYPLAEHFGRRVDAVTEVIEQVIEVTRTTELIITIPEPESLYAARHRVEDLHSPTLPLDESLRRAIASKREAAGDVPS